jgi:hypothetical protein
MSELKDLEQILRVYTQKKNTSSISRYKLERYAAHWAGELRKTRPAFTDFTGFTSAKYRDLLDSAEAEGICLVVSDEQGEQKIVYPKYFPSLLRKVYEEAEKVPESSFPHEDMLTESIPSEIVEVVEVKERLVSLLDEIRDKKSTIFRFLFPEGVRSLIVVGDLIPTTLMTMSIMKLRVYLSLQKNAEYVMNKMYGILPKKEQSVKDLFSNIMTQRDMAIKTITDPDDFTFQFWTYMSTLVVNEFREKTNKLDREHGFCQASYLLGLYVLYYKGIKKRKREQEQALRQIDQGILKPPYFHTFSDLYGMRDKLGLPIAKKVSQHDLAAYLERRTRKEKGSPLTEIMRIMTADKKEYFVGKERLLNLTLQRIQLFSREIRTQYIKEWAEALGDFKKLDVMNHRESFQNDLWRRLENQEPLLSRVLKYELILVCLKETKPSKEVYIEANRILDQKQQKLIPIDDILRLDQKRIMRDARTYLPLWKSIPLIGRLGVFFSKLFGKLAKGAEALKDPSDIYASINRSAGKDGQREVYTVSRGENRGDGYAGGAGMKQLGGVKPSDGGGIRSSSGDRAVNRQVEFKKAVYELKNKYLGPEGDLNGSLAELIEEWNPLVDSKAKQNLVEDVNSAVRDFIRKLKRSLMMKPPDEERIRNLSRQIAEYDAFKRIKNKDEFRRYVELYIIKTLSLS